jgi:hypothetical protein
VPCRRNKNPNADVRSESSRSFVLVILSLMLVSASSCSSGHKTSSPLTTSTSPESQASASDPLVSAQCNGAVDFVAVFFTANLGEYNQEVSAVRSVLVADPFVGLVGYVDQAASYQEYLNIFSRATAGSVLTQSDIPTSFRAFVAPTDVNSLIERVKAKRGVLKVESQSAVEKSVPGLGSVTGPVDLGHVIFERPTWKVNCSVGSWPAR